jgi:LacI family transcriptional regulator
MTEIVKAKKGKKTFVLVIPRFEDIFNSFYAGEIIKGVSLSASRLKIDVLMHITDRENHRTWLDSPLFERPMIDGILFADIDNDINVVKRSINRGIPTLVLNNYLKQPVNCISIDNYQAAVDVVERLVKLGHERIATIAGEQMTQAGQSRLMGFCDALEAIGLKASKPYIAYGNFLRTPARKAAERLLALKDRPTAIFAASDVMALEVIDVARSKRIKVPEELSIIGFDNNPIALASSISLTTFSQPLVEMGRLGIEHLKKISEGKEKLPFKLMLPAQYIEKQSVAKARESH